MVNHRTDGIFQDFQKFVMDYVYDYDLYSPDNLFFERGIMCSTMEGIRINGIQRTSYTVKNAEQSDARRREGNRAYGHRLQSVREYLDVLQLYTESIALARNNSEELALGYGNRSALLLRFEKYEECIQDCDRAIKETSSNSLKIKLLTRKVECLIVLKDNLVKNVYNEAVKLLKQASLNDQVRANLEKKLNSISTDIVNFTFQHKKNTEACSEFPSFESYEKIPNVSKAVKIAHNQTWGKHIIAKRNIEPGEILVHEKDYFSYPLPQTMYLICCNCSKLSFATIPCNSCIYNMYCSEKCKSEDWEKCHKFECPVYAYMCEKESDIRILFRSLRFLLLSVYNAGGIQQLQQQLIDVEKRNDPCTKVFTDDGVFHSEQPRSCLNLLIKGGEHVELVYRASDVCYTVYYLATKTTFFGQVYDIQPTQAMTAGPGMLFFAAMLYRSMFTIPCNSYNLLMYHHDDISTGFKPLPVGDSLYPFCSIFNHSCNPNADCFTTKNNGIVVYAKHPIKKGAQIFINYYGINMLLTPREVRRQLFAALKFRCKCLPCKEKWSHICLPLLKDLLSSTPEVANELQRLITDTTREIEREMKSDSFLYNKNVMRGMVHLLKEVAEKVTVNCEEYLYLAFIMKTMLIKSFGNIQNL